MYLFHLCLPAAWLQNYSVLCVISRLSNPDSFYDNLLELKTNPKDESTLVLQ